MKDVANCFWFDEGRRVMDFELVAGVEFGMNAGEQPYRATVTLAGGNKVEIYDSDARKLFRVMKQRWPEKPAKKKERS